MGGSITAASFPFSRILFYHMFISLLSDAINHESTLKGWEKYKVNIFIKLIVDLIKLIIYDYQYGAFRVSEYNWMFLWRTIHSRSWHIIILFSSPLPIVLGIKLCTDFRKVLKQKASVMKNTIIIILIKGICWAYYQYRHIFRMCTY